MEIYEVAHIEGTSPSPGTYRFWRIDRHVVLVAGRVGRFVRYDTHLQPLHDASEIRNLLREIRHKGAWTEGAFRHQRFNKDDEALPFVKCWEPSVGSYR